MRRPLAVAPVTFVERSGLVHKLGPSGLAVPGRSTAAVEALVLALAQWHAKRYPSKSEQPGKARTHMPNLAGGVAHWSKRERGIDALALHVADYAIAFRNAQHTLELPRSTVSAIAAGLDLTARPTRIDASALVHGDRPPAPESAAEFLSVGDREGAIDAAFVALHREREGNASWSVYDRVWKAVLRLLPTTAAHDRVAKEAFQTLSDEGDRALPLANTLARTADVIEWGQVSATVQSDWRGWRARADVTDDNRALVDIIDRALNEITPDLSDEAGILRAAFVADNGIPDGADSDILSEAAEAIIMALDKERKAAPGVMFFGGPAASKVAAAFAFRFDNQRVWEALTEFLLDPAIHGATKALALDRIAGQIGEVPVSFSAAIKDGFAGLEGSVRSEHFGNPAPSKFFAEAIRVGLLVEAISRERALSVVIELAASNVRDRIEAAKTIPFAIMSGPDMGPRAASATVA